MENTKMSIAIGTVGGSQSDLRSTLSKLTGKEVGHVQVYSLAGPNSLVQILADVPTWAMLGTAATYFLRGFLSEAGKRAFRLIAPPEKAMSEVDVDKLKSLIEDLQKDLKKEQELGQDVSIGLLEPSFCLSDRGDRVFLTDLSPEAVAKCLYIFSHCAGPMSLWLSEVYKTQTEKGEVNVTMQINNEMLVVQLHPILAKPLLPGSVYKRTYDSNGNIVDEKRID